MLEEQQLVADPPVGALGDERLLERVRRPVVDAPEPARVQRGRRSAGCGRAGIRIDEGGLHHRTIAGVPRHPVDSG